MSTDGPAMGLLVVGTGFLGAQRAAAAMRTPRVRLVAVTDRDPALAERGRGAVRGGGGSRPPGRARIGRDRRRRDRHAARRPRRGGPDGA